MQTIKAQIRLGSVNGDAIEERVQRRAQAGQGRHGRAVLFLFEQSDDLIHRAEGVTQLDLRGLTE